jgi:hypothetical protein
MVALNSNFLAKSKFHFVIEKLPTLNYFIQSVILPGMIITEVEQPNPNIIIPLQGDHLDFSDLEITFKLDEDFRSWIETFAWMRAITFPKNSIEFAHLKAGKILPTFTVNKSGYIYSDASLFITSNHSNSKFEVKFINAWPTSLSPIDFSSTLTDEEYIDVSVSFKFEQFYITRC